jgi:hypothetical protein
MLPNLSSASDPMPELNQLATVALANYDARVRFETRSTRGNSKRALALLERLDPAG